MGNDHSIKRHAVCHSNPSYPGPTQNKQMSPTTLILNKIDEDKHLSPLCLLCKSEPHTTTHLFNCTSINTQLKVTDLWTAPVEVGHLLLEWKGATVNQRARMPARWGDTICRCAQKRLVDPSTIFDNNLLMP